MIEHERRRRKSYVAKLRPKYYSEDYKKDEFPTTQYTEAEQALIKELTRKGVEYTTQVPFERKSERTVKGEPKQYIADVLIKDTKIIIEIEGSKSSSSENPNREKFFKEKGYQIIHVPNELAIKYPAILSELIKAFTDEIFI
jgi:very-short-patch-repair endonuclease